MIMITTSRRPTRRVRSFVNDLARSIPDSVRVNRGKLSLLGVAQKAAELGADRVIVVDRWKGGPGKMELFHVGGRGLRHHPPLVYIAGVRLQRECGVRAKPARELTVMVEEEVGDEVKRLADALSQFLEAPRVYDLEEARGRLMLLTKDPQRFARITFLDTPELREVGPVIRVRHLVWNP